MKKKVARKMKSALGGIKKTSIYKKMEPYYHGQVYKRLYEEEQQLTRYFMENADITTMKKASGGLREIQERLLFFADEIFELLKPLDIHPFMVGGTLIGALRHKGFIPWDDDLDFGLMREEYNRVIEFCKRTMIVDLYEGSYKEYTPEIHINRFKQKMEEHPNELILEIWIDQIQIYRGTNVLNREVIDFWALDSFRDSYTFSQHLDYLEYLRKKKGEIDKVNEIHNFLEQELAANPNFDSDGEQCYFGMENFVQYTKKNDRFIPRNYLLPTIEMEFEGRKWLAPANPDGYIRYEYPEYMGFPMDVGRKKHNYWDTYFETQLVQVEFNLVDAFEIYHFLPLYHAFRSHGIHARFVAEPCGKDAWFDYETAVKILKEKNLHYTEKCNPNADLAITTQGYECLSKYKKKKAVMTYGVGFLKNSFHYKPGIVEKFDLCLTSGTYPAEKFEKYLSKDKIWLIGYPKYKSFFENPPTKDEIKRELQIETKKDILVYFPTWDENSSISVLCDTIKELRERFFVVTKAHHCTWRLKEKKEDLKKLFEMSDLVLEGNFDFAKAALLADYAICDAKSAASSEIPYLNLEVKEVLYNVANLPRTEFFEEIFEIAPMVNNPEELENMLFTGLEDYVDRRKSIIEACYGNPQKDYLTEIAEKIVNLRRD